MSLIKNMVLIITVVFSNNDKIIFEFGESLYSSRVITLDDNGNQIDETQIMRENDSLVYTFNLNLEEFRVSNFPDNSFNSTKFDTYIIPHAEEIKICGYSVLKVEKNIFNSSAIVSYFLRTDEISELINKSEFINSIIDNKSDLLFLYADFSNPVSKKILNINVEWSSGFSNELDNKIEMIKRKQ